MNRLDTIKVQIPLENVLSINKSYFRHCSEADYNTGLIISDYKLSRDFKKPLGISSIIFNENTLTLEFSAKLLKENYYGMITENNITEIENIINKLDIIKLKPNSIVKGICRRADITINIPVKEQVDNYVNALFTFDNTNKYHSRDYKNREGIEFINKNKTKRLQDRIIFYDKSTEILKDKELIKYVNPDTFKKVLRYENNVNHNTIFRRVLNRKDLGKETGNIMLKEVLESKENAYLINFKKLFGQNPIQPIQSTFTDNELFIINSDKPFKYKKEQLGLKVIVRFCNSDYDSMKRYLLKHYKVKATVYRYLKQLVNALKESKNTDYRISENKYIAEILETIETA